MLKIILLSTLLFASQFSFARTVELTLSRTDCDKFADQLLFLNSEMLTDVNIELVSCEMLQDLPLSPYDKLKATLSLDFESCSTNDYTIKNYKRASFQFIDHNGLKTFMPAIGLRLLGTSPTKRFSSNLYGIPICD